MPLTRKEAEDQIPLLLERLALMAIDTVIQLDKFSVDSLEVESRIMSMQGYMSKLWKLFMIVCKSRKKVEKII